MITFIWMQTPVLQILTPKKIKHCHNQCTYCRRPKPPSAKSDDGRLLRGRTRSERNSSFFLPTSSPRMAGSAWTASEDQESSFVLRNLQAMSKSLIEEEAEEEGSLLIQLLADKTPTLLLHLCLSPVLSILTFPNRFRLIRPDCGSIR